MYLEVQLIRLLVHVVNNNAGPISSVVRLA